MRAVNVNPAPASAGVSLGLRRFLYGTAATTGAAILVIEILGAKMLTPYVGTSHFVWTAQIAVTLISLAAGYWFGGWLVDRSPDLRRLYTCVLLAGLYLCFTVPFTAHVAFLTLRLPLPIGSLLASLFLFFVPLTLLATVGPFVIRVLTSAVAGVGGTVGRLSAVSTLGSVAGTVLIGYVLIPLMPNSWTMFATAGVLMALAVFYFAIWGKAGAAGRVLLVTVLALVGGGVGIKTQDHPWSEYLREVARRHSYFGELQVFEPEDGSHRYYLNDYLPQNNYDPAAKQSISLFTYGLHGLAQRYAKSIDDVLCIGLGVGIVPMEFVRDGARVDVVEINEAVVPLAVEYFDLETAKMQISIGDGRQFVDASSKSYDVIILDAFVGDAAPSHLMTREAFAAMRRILRPDGVLVINCLGDFAPGWDFLTASMEQTLQAVFGAVRIHAVGAGNVFFVATPAAELVQRRELNFDAMHPNVRERMREIVANVRETDPRSGRVLTDDFNPVEFHDAPNRERMRRRLVEWMHPETDGI